MKITNVKTHDPGQLNAPLPVPKDFPVLCVELEIMVADDAKPPAYSPEPAKVHVIPDLLSCVGLEMAAPGSNAALRNLLIARLSADPGRYEEARAAAEELALAWGEWLANSDQFVSERMLEAMGAVLEAFGLEVSS